MNPNIKKLNTNYIFTFCDGTTAKLTLTFYALYQLREKNRSLYERYNKIIAKSTSDILEMITILYTAYVCANLDEENILNEMDFMMLCGHDMRAVGDAVKALTTAKKN